MGKKTKRLFSSEETFMMSSQTKKFKVHHNQVSNTMKNSLTTDRDFLKHSSVQTSDKERVSLVKKARPASIMAYIGQKQIIGPDTVLRHLLERKEIPSMIFWGPPGCGKTSLTNIIECLCKETMHNEVHIVNLSTRNSGVKDIKNTVATSNEKSKFGYKTIVFMDEIHRFNKLQQDIFLPHVEAGTFTLIGCTTENPFYSLNSALLSRCRVFMLNKLTESNMKEIICKAVKCINESGTQERTQTENKRQNEFHANSNSKIHIDNETIEWLAEACDGDARVALNTIELTVTNQVDKAKTYINGVTITLQDVKENLMRTHLLSDKENNQSYRIYSALHKSIRAGKTNASLYWLARIMAAKEDPVNIARRLVRISSEDVGLADPDALGIAIHTMHGCQMIGMPECDVLLGQCTVYLAKAPKSRLIYNALKTAEKIILDHEGPQPTVPLHMRCDSTNVKLQSYTDNLVTHESCSKSYSKSCLPEELQHINFFQEKESL